MTDQTATQATGRSKMRRWLDAFLHRGPGYDLGNPVADALAAEYHRRYQRLEDLAKGPNAQVAVVEHVRGELVGLRGALGVLLGGSVQDGTADLLGWAHYQEWRRRQEGRS